MAKVYALVVTGNSDGQFVQNVFHYQGSEAGSFDGFSWAFDLISAWTAANESSFLACMPGTYTLLSYRARRVSSPGGPTALQLSGASGTFSGNTSTAGQSVEIGIPAVVAGKNVTGKIFLPGVPSGVWLDNFLDPTYKSIVDAFGIQQLISLSGPATGSTYDYGVYRRPKGAAPEAFTHAQHHFVSTHPVTIKRRNVPV